MTVLNLLMTCLIDHTTDTDFDASSTYCQLTQDELQKPGISQN